MVIPSQYYVDSLNLECFGDRLGSAHEFTNIKYLTSSSIAGSNLDIRINNTTSNNNNNNNNNNNLHNLDYKNNFQNTNQNRFKQGLKNINIYLNNKYNDTNNDNGRSNFSKKINLNDTFNTRTELSLNDLRGELNISNNDERNTTTTTTTTTTTRKTNEMMDRSKVRKLTKFYKHNLHDPTINAQVVSLSTLKYALIALVAVCFVAFLLALFILGLLNFDVCHLNSPNDMNLAVYLMVMGATGIVRVIMFFSCPFDYSNSILNKMYEHLVWRLFVNRFRQSCSWAKNQIFHTCYHGNELELVESEHSCCKNVLFKLGEYALFVFSFFCCNCCCLRSYGKNEPNQVETSNYNDPVPEVSVTFYDPSNHGFHLGAENELTTMSKSVSNISGLTQSSISSKAIILNDIYCFKPLESLNMIKTNDDGKKKSTLKRSPSSSSYKFPRSKSDNELVTGQRMKRVRNNNSKKVKFSRSEANTYGRQYFSGKYNHKYATHKHLKKHHNRAQKPINLFDFHSIRYCVTHLFQRLLDIFIICWFVCGNYWVFTKSPHPYLSDEAVQFMNATTSTMPTNRSSQTTMDKNVSLTKTISTRHVVYFSMTINNQTLKAQAQMTCYNVAFIQIVSTYSLICLLVLFVIVYHLYSLLCLKKKDNNFNFPRNNYFG